MAQNTFGSLWSNSQSCCRHNSWFPHDPTLAIWFWHNLIACWCQVRFMGIPLRNQSSRQGLANTILGQILPGCRRFCFPVLRGLFLEAPRSQRGNGWPSFSTWKNSPFRGSRFFHIARWWKSEQGNFGNTDCFWAFFALMSHMSISNLHWMNHEKIIHNLILLFTASSS